MVPPLLASKWLQCISWLDKVGLRLTNGSKVQVDGINPCHNFLGLRVEMPSFCSGTRLRQGDGRTKMTKAVRDKGAEHRFNRFLQRRTGVMQGKGRQIALRDSFSQVSSDVTFGF